MPAAVVAVASFIGNAVAVVTTSAALGAAVANGIVALGFGAGFGAAISAWSTVAAVGSLFVKPKIGAATGGSGAQLNFKADPSAAIPYVIGRTATAGNVIHANTSGSYDKNQHLLFCTVLSGAGPIQEFEGFAANGEAVTFTGEGFGGGQCLTGRFANAMDLRNQLGSQTPAAFPYCSVPDGTLPEWTSAHRLTGFAASWWGLNFSQTVFPTGVPKPLWTLKGVLAYDPRLDSTYPGGSGSQRANNEATWTFTENPWLHALTWCLGRMQAGLRILGVGAAVASIDVAAYVEAANIADANGWKAGGVVYSSDPKWDVLQAICQAGGGAPMRMGSKLSCFVNAPKVSLGTLTGKDVDGDPSITTTQARRARINRVIPRYRSEAHGWEMVAADPVAVDDYIEQDDGRRSKEYEFPLVQDVDQASQLAAYEILNGREFGPLSLPLIPRWMGLQPGDAFVMDEDEFGLSDQKLLVVSRDRDPGTGMRTLICRSETDSKHDFALGVTGAAPPTPGLGAVDVADVERPGAGAWTLAGASLANNQAITPALSLTGAFDNPNATAMLVEYKRSADADWILWGYAAPSSTKIYITGVAADASYDVRTAYLTARGVSSWRSEGTVTAGSSAVTDQSDWATYNTLTPGQIAGRTVYLDDATGQLTSVLGLGQPTSGFGQALTIDSQPITTDDSHIYIAAFNVSGFGGFTRNFSSGSFSGFPSGFNWHVIVYWPTGGFGVAHNDDLQSYLATGDWFLLGIAATSVSGVPTPPAIETPGAYGGGAIDFFYRDVN